MLIFQAPQDITFPTIASLWARYRADDVNVSDIDRIDQMNDLSGNGRHLVATTTLRPVLLASAINGHPAADFDGTNHRIGLGSLTLAQPIHSFLVVRQNTWTSNDRLVSFSTVANLRVKQSGTSPEIKQNNNSDQNGNTVSLTLGTWGLVGSLFDGAGSHQTLNDGAESSGTSMLTPALNSIGIADETSGSAQKGDITVAELVVTSAEVTGADLTALKAYFNDRYNLW